MFRIVDFIPTSPRWAFAILSLISPLCASANAAENRMELPPVSQWQLHVEPNSCLALRDFGTEQEQTSLSIEQFGMGEDFQLIVVSAALRGVDDRTRLAITYGEGRSHVIDNPLTGTDKSWRRTIFVGSSALRGKDGAPSTAPRSKIETETRSIEFSWRGKSLLLKTGTLAPLFREMQTCIDNMYERWGLNPVEQRELSEPLVPLDEPENWLRPSDYPPVQAVLGRQSLLSVALLVNAEGTPTDCTITRSYGNDDFNKQTCVLMLERARFKPARNSTGDAVRSAYVETVVWLNR